MPVDSKHPQYSDYAKKWERCSDCISGEDAVKAKKTVYLPMPSAWEKERYDKYLFRATFLEFAGRVLGVSLGQIFRKSPVTQNIPEEILKDVDLRGTSFDYFWRQVASEMISKNRVGIFVDYNTEMKRPYLVLYKAESIINWQTEIVNGVEKLSLVVLEGQAPKETQADKYKIEMETHWKVIELADGKVIVTDYRRIDGADGKTGFEAIDAPRVMEMNSQGDTRNYIGTIPFYFVTTNGVSAELLNPPILPVVNLNLGHYMGYADLNWMLFITSQKTVITIEGDDKDFPIGGVINFKTASGNAFFMEATPNSGTRDELTHKEQLMAALSSSFLSGSGRYVASAETARITSEGEYASLADVSNAASISATQIMSFLVSWYQNKEIVCPVSFNTDFEMKDIDPAYLTALMGAVGSGYMSFETFYYNLRNKEVYPPNSTLEDEQKQIEEYAKKQIDKREETIGRKFDVQPSTEDDI